MGKSPGKRPQPATGPDFLRKALIDVERRFLAVLEQKRLAINHNSTLGDAVEEEWIELLKEYLPARYRVAKAFAIDHEGNSTDQLDCLVYDAHFTPTLFGRERHRYVPAEAVYATFEVKQFVTTPNLRAAGKKAASIRRLARTSAPIPWMSGLNDPKPPFPILAGLLAMRADWRDGLGVAFSRQVRAHTEAEHLDLVLTASSGFYACSTKDGDARVVIGEGSLVRGLFHLLHLLREKATVTAIEWGAYDAVLAPRDG